MAKAAKAKVRRLKVRDMGAHRTRGPGGREPVVTQRKRPGDASGRRTLDGPADAGVPVPPHDKHHKHHPKHKHDKHHRHVPASKALSFVENVSAVAFLFSATRLSFWKK